MRRTFVRGGACALMISAAVAAGCQPRPQSGWSSRLVSVSASGDTAGNAASTDPVFSPDGGRIAFVSRATDLGPADVGYFGDVYVRDLESGEVTLVSGNAEGTAGGNGESSDPVFSPDGTQVLFTSEASDLGPADTNRSTDVYLHDLATGDTVLVSVNGAGSAAGDHSTQPGVGGADSFAATFSPDGGRVLFTSRASDLGPSDPNGWYTDLYLRDLATGTTGLVSIDATGTRSGNGQSANPEFSRDGRKIVFDSSANNLTDPGAGGGNVFVRDLDAGVTQLVSVEHDPADSGSSDQATFSPDGTKVTFVSSAISLVPLGVDIADRNVYVRDLTDDTTVLVSADRDGAPGGGDYHSDEPTFSPDGRFVAFSSYAVNLTDDPSPGHGVYLWEVETGEMRLVSKPTAAQPATHGWSDSPVFSPDGTRLLFHSDRPDLVPEDVVTFRDLYLYDIATEANELVTRNLVQRGGGNDTSGVHLGGSVFSADGRHIAYESLATDLTEVDDGNDQWSDADVFVASYDDFGDADVAVDVTASADAAAAGDPLTYRVTATNDGPATARSVQLVLGFGPGLEPNEPGPSACGSSVGTSDGGRIVVCDLGAVAAGGTATLDVGTTVVADTAGTIETWALSSVAPEFDRDSTDDRATVSIEVTG